MRDGGYSLRSIWADTLADLITQQPNLPVLDVRRESEYDSGHVLVDNVPRDVIN